MGLGQTAILLGSALISLLPFSSNQGHIDNRCYLENGASSESFFVPEDLPVGSTVGQVRVHGDPRPGGTVSLRLKEADSPVAVAPGTKNLTLRRRLDKEGVEGPSSVFVNLICERLLTLDPVFVIPVNIRVTDANDNAPVFVNAPYGLNISEVTVVGTRVLQGVRAVDADQQGPFSTVRYSVVPGPDSDHFDFENELEGTLVLRKPLDYETLRSFAVKIRAQDGGEPPRTADTVLEVRVTDADDQNPRFLEDRYTAPLPEPATEGAVLEVQPREIRAVDQDEGINAGVYYTFNGIGSEYGCFRIDRESGKVSLTKDVAEKEFHNPVTLVLRATQVDNADRYALATLTVSSKHSDDAIRFLHKVFYVKVSEGLPVGSIVATLANNRPGEPLKYYVSDQDILKVFAFNTNGEISLKKKLDYEEKPEYIFKVFATDGITNDSSVVNITLTDVNEWEPRFRYPQYEFFAAGVPDELVGRVEAADGDRGDAPTLSLAGANASLFLVTPGGELRLGELKAPAAGSATLVVVAEDRGGKRASVPVTVRFPGGGRAEGRFGGESSAVLAGLGAVLAVLAVVVAVLVVYICKGKRSASRREELPSLPTSSGSEKSNPIFHDRMRSTGSVAGMPSDAKSRIPSPKVHPAPQPPSWPHATVGARVKKLSWGDDKTESSSNENVESVGRPMESSNLTVYF